MILRDLFSWLKAPTVISADPFDHPEVMRMSERELGDLPWPRPEAARTTAKRPATAIAAGRGARVA